LPRGALVAAEVAGDFPRIRWPSLIGLIFSCVIPVFGLAHHGLAIARKTEPAHAGRVDHELNIGPQQLDGWFG
jgi:hypothetical protein